MLGAVIGDIVGSRFEFDNCRSTDFELFDEACSFTDDSVLTAAVCDALLQKHADTSIDLSAAAAESIRRWALNFPGRGYGNRFEVWCYSTDARPYNSLGNGSAMRVSPCAWAANSLEEALSLAETVTAVTHNHPEGIRGAKATAGATFLARMGKSKEAIRDFVERGYYTIDFTLDEIRGTYEFNDTCPGSMPQAFAAFLESMSFEDCLRLAVSVGGDSDTIAAIAASVAHPFYGIPQAISESALAFVKKSPELWQMLSAFDEVFGS